MRPTRRAILRRYQPPAPGLVAAPDRPPPIGIAFPVGTSDLRSGGEAGLVSDRVLTSLDRTRRAFHSHVECP